MGDHKKKVSNEPKEDYEGTWLSVGFCGCSEQICWVIFMLQLLWCWWVH